jgi:hypothetical protein
LKVIENVDIFIFVSPCVNQVAKGGSGDAVTRDKGSSNEGGGGVEGGVVDGSSVEGGDEDSGGNREQQR